MVKEHFSVQKKRRIIMAFCGASGVGKTTLIREMMSRYPDLLLSLAATTRTPREQESENKSKYIFVSESRFQKMKDDNQFLEYAQRYNNYYGELRYPLMDPDLINKDAIIDTTFHGAQNISVSIQHEVVTIGILPPSTEELLNRLKEREPNKLKETEKRFESFGHFISQALLCDYFVINDDLTKTIETICAIYESLKTNKQYAQIYVR